MASAVIVLVTVLAVVGLEWSWHASEGTSPLISSPVYVFSPCPGLTVTSSATTGIWNCPNQSVTDSSSSYTAGGNVKLSVDSSGCEFSVDQ